MPFEETGKTRVRTNCLNFDVSLCIRILKKISVRGRRHWAYILWDFRSCCIPVCTKFRSLITNVLL